MNSQPPLAGLPADLDTPTDAVLYDPFREGLTRCAVVIDTRNMHGQTRKLFGRGLRPYAHGVRTALRKYGLDAVEIFAGVATKTMAKQPSTRVQSALEDNMRYAVELVKQDAVVLSGHLAERGGEMDEKQVDVLLALRVADLADRIVQLKGTSGTAPECIVVLSEDMDLMPAYEFATQRGVRVYAAAFDTVHNREDQTSWLLLDEDSVRLICPPPAPVALGTAARQIIARMATSPAPVQAPSWTVEGWDNQERLIILSNSRGLTGVLHEKKGRGYIGSRMNLFATGIEMEPKSKRFPLLTLDRARPTGSGFHGVEYATVLYWVAPTRVKVQFERSEDTATLSISPGQLLSGQRVAVFGSTDGEGRVANYYVGPVGDPPERDGWPLEGNTAVVTIREAHGKSLWRAQIDALGTDVLVPTQHLTHARIGDRLLVALAGRLKTGHLLAQPLTCCLPGSGSR